MDDIVSNLQLSDPVFNSSESELAKLLTAASQLKQQLLNPSLDSPPETPSFIHFNGTSASPGAVSSKPSFEARIYANTSVTSNSTLAKAREIVRLAQLEANAKNVERLNNPRLNTYFSKDTEPQAKGKRALAATLFEVNSTVADAAALVAEADAAVDDGTPSEAELYAARIGKRDIEKRAGPY